jgi:uncharacterized protein with GYD domain
MPTFVTTFAYNGERWQELAENPMDRSVPLRKLIEQGGGRLISMYYTAGHYDGFVIYEAADARVVAAAIVVVGLARNRSDLKTSQLFSVAEATEFIGHADWLSETRPTR